ncbi:ABC transporter substrate-binding protein [Paenibacillus sp.]|uniref:ABC transporter substrate-binding protein n=1 Tax=Paenibacillus sp. TaxID=58172 RepID=UPI002D574991|nr:extracellular solute-binding protein [Paenibacillus sp.]HZG55040.1 extracellular solute-binding protein [Paenibacillus sp.]
MRRKSAAWVMAFLLLVTTACAGGAGTSNPPAEKPAEKPAATASETPAASEEPAAADSEIKGEITWATHRTDFVESGLFDAYVAKFKEKYPNVTDVKIEGLPDYGQTIRVRMAANEVPDVLSPPDMVLENFPSLYVPLDDLGLKGNIHLEETGMYEGKLYTVTSGAGTNGIIYNKKAFAAAGLSGPPKTLDEFWAAAEALKKAGLVAMNTDFKDGWTAQYYYDIATFLTPDGINYHNLIFKSDPPLQIDGPIGQGLGVLKKLIDGGYVEPDLFSTDWEGSIRDIAQGRAGMYFIGQWLLPQMETTGGGNPADFGFVPFPYDNSGTYKAVLGGDYHWAVSATSDNIPTAKAWVKFLLEESDYANDSGLLPTLKTRESNIPQLAEFNSFNPTYLPYDPPSQDATKVEQHMQFDAIKFMQEAVTSPDMAAVFDAYGKKYADAKKSLGF